MPKKKPSLLSKEFKEEVSNEIIRDVLVDEIAEEVASAETEKVKKKAKGLPLTIVLKEVYIHPKTPQCKGCPHPEGRYVHPREPVCIIPRYEHPEEIQCLHNHEGDILKPEQIHPLYCSLRTATIKEDQITDLDHDAQKIKGKTVDDSGIADGKVLTYKSASGNIEYDVGGGGGGAPTDAEYVVTALDATLSAEKLHNALTGGDLHSPKTHNLGGSEHGADTLANLNAKVSDATLDDSGDSRTPSAHDLAGALHNADTLADLNAKISDATLVDMPNTIANVLSDHTKTAHDALDIDAATLETSTKAQVQDHTPKAHNLGGAEHGADTLANLNAKISDATLADKTLTTQGDVLFHDASGLQRLAAGTSGRFLKTQGAGANPMWDTPSGGVSFGGFKVYSTAFCMLTAGAWTTIPLNTEVWDDGGDFNNSTYVWTVPTTGRYFLAFQIAASFQDGEAIQGVVRQTVSPFRALIKCFNSAGGGGSISAASSSLCSLTAGDTYHVRAYISAGGNRLLLTGEDHTYFVVGKL